jgi:hypothetical protein
MFCDRLDVDMAVLVNTKERTAHSTAVNPGSVMRGKGAHFLPSSPSLFSGRPK